MYVVFQYTNFVIVILDGQFKTKKWGADAFSSLFILDVAT